MARFAHTYDAPHVLLQVEAFLIAFMDGSLVTDEWENDLREGETGRIYNKTVLEWAAMADKYGMHKLLGHCKQVMVMYWKSFGKTPGLVDQLSHSALVRIAKAFLTLLAANVPREQRKYPPGR